MRIVMEIIIDAIVVSPFLAMLASAFLGWFFFFKDRSWVSKWWFIVGMGAWLASLPTGIAAYRRVAGLEPITELTIWIALSFLVTTNIPTIIATVIAYHYFVIGGRIRRLVLDKAEEEREKRRTAHDDAREAKLDEQDAAREVRKDDDDIKRERKDDKADISREEIRNNSDDFREEHHARRLEGEKKGGGEHGDSPKTQR